MIQNVTFIAKWKAKLVEAVEISGDWFYNIKERFIPVNEATLPYNMPVDLSVDDQRRSLLASTAVDLLSSFTGHNLDMSNFVCEPSVIGHRLFSGGGTTALQDGDCLMILVPQMGE